MELPVEIANRLRLYNERRCLRVLNNLGDGKDGFVFTVANDASPTPWTEKVFFHNEVYQRERNVYLRLKESRTTEINGLSVPQLIAFDDGPPVIEMSIISRPWILDFASGLDEPETFGEEQMNYYEEKIRELFDDRASDVFELLHRLQADYGIWYYDARPGNIEFEHR